MAGNQFKSLVHHVINMCSDNPAQLGATRLNKILWYSDAIAYQVRGKPITNATYIKLKYGPAPKHVLPTLNELRDDGKIVIKDGQYEFDPRKFISMISPNDGVFSEEEKHIITTVVDFVLQRTASEISEASHDVIWKAAKEGEEIPLYATLASVPGLITEEDIRWANGIADKHEIE